MDHIDEFESMFRRAERVGFEHAVIPLNSITLVTDQSAEDAARQKANLLTFIPMLEHASDWRLISGDEFSNVGELLAKIDEQQTDLVVTWRHLQEEALVPQHSLGVYLDVLTQATSIPVLVLPGTALKPKDLSGNLCDRTMVVADHISGDNGLINYGVRFCPDGGTFWLCHVEDDAVFERYMATTERIPEIDSEQARQLIGATLLKEASDFIESCIEELKTERSAVQYESRVTRGHFLRQYTELVEEAGIDLLVANTKDEDQLAMHGMAYSLSVELNDIALLLL